MQNLERIKKELLTTDPQTLFQYKNQHSDMRHIINMAIKYRIHNDKLDKTGRLLNLSQTGALISVAEKLEPETPVTLIIEPEEVTAEKPIYVDTVIIRDRFSPQAGCYMSDCHILSVNDPN